MASSTMHRRAFTLALSFIAASHARLASADETYHPYCPSPSSPKDKLANLTLTAAQIAAGAGDKAAPLLEVDDPSRARERFRHEWTGEVKLTDYGSNVIDLRYFEKLVVGSKLGSGRIAFEIAPDRDFAAVMASGELDGDGGVYRIGAEDFRKMMKAVVAKHGFVYPHIVPCYVRIRVIGPGGSKGLPSNLVTVRVNCALQ